MTARTPEEIAREIAAKIDRQTDCDCGLASCWSMETAEKLIAQAIRAERVQVWPSEDEIEDAADGYAKKCGDLTAFIAGVRWLKARVKDGV
jgi:hypothetical protein